MRRPLAAAAVIASVALAACKHDGGREATQDAPGALASATLESADAPIDVALSKTDKLAAIAMQTNVYARPSDASKKIGYLRLGAIVLRSSKSYGEDGCPGGWYAIAPRGFVCVGKSATLDVTSPLVRAASRRPDTSAPLPYPYGFVRAVAPLYLRLPSKEEQLASEFHLANHLAWWERKGHEENGPHDGTLLGGASDHAAPPFWLETGARKIANVSGFDVPQTSIFANRVRRHTGLAFVDAFDTGPEFGGRRFSVTTDMRMLPTDKIKPEPGSQWHGVELVGGLTLPIAFAKPCNPNAKGTPRPCVHTYRDDDGTLVKSDEIVDTRALLPLTGIQRKSKNDRYLQTKLGTWVRARDVGVAIVPDEWPQAAQRGEKWIDVSIEDQTLVLWEGQKPIFATLVSTGQDGMQDPKTTKSTPRGTFRIKSKHITATMDSNERSAQSGGAAPDKNAGESADADEPKHAGQFELRDVPYVQYFQDGYALHAAYWHDHFGLARSHGCVNLAPADAMRVFAFTDPPIPDGWHGLVVDAGKGTSVVIHR